MAIADLTVRGAGIFGLSIAWEALERGAKLRLIDPGGPGAGASGGIVGALAPHVPDNWTPVKAFQLEALQMQEEFWSRLRGVSGIDPGYLRSGRLQPLADPKAMERARDRATAAAEAWGAAALWEVVDETTAGRWRPLSPTGHFVRDTLSARINPRRAVECIAGALAARGVSVDRSGENAGAVIWATGWQGLVDLGHDLDRDCGGGVKGQAALLHLNAGDAPQVYADGLHIVPHGDGTVAVGSTSERDFDDPGTTDARLDEIVERACLVMPVLRGARIVERWAGVRPRAPSRAPLIGPWPGRDGHFVANGGFKIGFGIAPAVAKAVCDLVLDGRDTRPEGFGTEALT